MPMSHEALNPKSKDEVHPLKQECFPAAVLGVHLRTGPASPSLSDTTGVRGHFLTLTANQRISSILSLKPVEHPNHHHQALTIIGIHQVGIWCPRTKVLPPRALSLPLSLCIWRYHGAYTPSSTQVTPAARTDTTLHFRCKQQGTSARSNHHTAPALDCKPAGVAVKQSCCFGTQTKGLSCSVWIPLPCHQDCSIDSALLNSNFQWHYKFTLAFETLFPWLPEKITMSNNNWTS